MAKSYKSQKDIRKGKKRWSWWSKVQARIVLHSIQEHLENLIEREHIGCRSKSSCADLTKTFRIVRRLECIWKKSTQGQLPVPVSGEFNSHCQSDIGLRKISCIASIENLNVKSKSSHRWCPSCCLFQRICRGFIDSFVFPQESRLCWWHLLCIISLLIVTPNSMLVAE